MAQELSDGSRRVSAPTVRRLRMRIAATRVTQRHVADKLGIAESHLSNILSGRKHADDMALRARIAQAIEDVAGETAA